MYVHVAMSSLCYRCVSVTCVEEAIKQGMFPTHMRIQPGQHHPQVITCELPQITGKLAHTQSAGKETTLTFAPQGLIQRRGGITVS